MNHTAGAILSVDSVSTSQIQLLSIHIQPSPKLLYQLIVFVAHDAEAYALTAQKKRCTSGCLRRPSLR